MFVSRFAISVAAFFVQEWVRGRLSLHNQSQVGCLSFVVALLTTNKKVSHTLLVFRSAVAGSHCCCLGHIQLAAAPIVPMDRMFDDSSDDGVTVAPEGKRGRHDLMLSQDVVDMLLGRIAGRSLPKALHKHLSKCCAELNQGILKSLGLKEKITKLEQQIESLGHGNAPPGVKPFRVGVEVPELDVSIPADMRSFTVTFDEGTTFRQAKEKLHYTFVAYNKVFDTKVMTLQLANLKGKISMDSFQSACTAHVSDSSESVNRLLTDLDLVSTLPSIDQMRITREKAKALYSDCVEKISAKRDSITAAKARSEESVAKKVDKLKNSSPSDLLEIKIAQSVNKALKSRASASTKGVDPAVDYGLAYTMKVTDVDNFEESVTVRPPPGLFPPGSFRRPPDKKGGGKGANTGGKGKGHKGGNKGKGKGKNASASNVPKGPKAHGSLTTKGKGKDKGRGKGKGKGKGKKKT